MLARSASTRLRFAAWGATFRLITYGGSLWKTLDAASALAGENIDAEVIDLRSLRPLDDATIMASVTKTRRAVIVDEGWRSGSLSAEICTRIVEQAFWELDAPIGRVCSEEVPVPYPRHLEERGDPSGCEDCNRRQGGAWPDIQVAPWSEFRMPSLGADMEAGTLVEWMIKPGDRVKRGDIVAVVETQKGAIEIEIFETGRVEHVLVEVDAKVPVGTPLARIRAEAEAEPRLEATPPPIAVTTPVAAAVAAPSAAPPPAARSHLRRRPKRRPHDGLAGGSAVCLARGIDLSADHRQRSRRRHHARRHRAPVAARHAAGEKAKRSIGLDLKACEPRSPPRWHGRSGKSRTTISSIRSMSPDASNG